MKHSIVMPCLLRRENHREVVIECLESIKAISPEAELIIVDDGSPLDTMFLRKYADILVNHSKTMGIAFGWNNGMRLASGDYITVINDDIVVKEGWLEAMVRALEEIEGAMVSAPAIQHMPNGTGIEEQRVWFPGSCFMITPNTIDKVGYFDEQFVPFNYEDVDYWTRVYKEGGKLVRNYSVMIDHKEGDVIHAFEDNGRINDANKDKYLKKWGFDPIPIFYHGDTLPF